MKKFMNFLDTMTECIGCVCLAVMIVAIMMQVIWRYILQSPLSWPEEVGQYTFLISTYMGISLCMKDRGHLRIMLLPESIAILKWPLDVLSMLANVLFFALCTYLSYNMVVETFNTEMECVAIPLQMWMIQIFIPLSCFLVLIQATINLIHIIKKQ